MYPGCDLQVYKNGYFTYLAHHYSATIVAQLNLDNAYKLYGLPRTIVFDNDKIFTTQFCKKLFTFVGTITHLSIFYHPQTDGPTERLDRMFGTIFKSHVKLQARQWHKWLSLEEW